MSCLALCPKKFVNAPNHDSAQLVLATVANKIKDLKRGLRHVGDVLSFPYCNTGWVWTHAKICRASLVNRGPCW